VYTASGWVGERHPANDNSNDKRWRSIAPDYPLVNRPTPSDTVRWPLIALAITGLQNRYSPVRFRPAPLDQHDLSMDNAPHMCVGRCCIRHARGCHIPTGPDVGGKVPWMLFFILFPPMPLWMSLLNGMLFSVLIVTVVLPILARHLSDGSVRAGSACPPKTTPHDALGSPGLPATATVLGSGGEPRIRSSHCGRRRCECIILSGDICECFWRFLTVSG